MKREDLDIALGHVHTWTNKQWVDFCHYQEIRKTCKTCGSEHREAAPRDFALNPLQIAFADPDCKRCRAAVKGIEPPSWKAARV